MSGWLHRAEQPVSVPSLHTLLSARWRCRPSPAGTDTGALVRSLKSANVLVSCCVDDSSAIELGSVQVGDLGLAMTSSQASVQARRAGTPMFMAPELLGPNPTASTATDGELRAGVALAASTCRGLLLTPLCPAVYALGGLIYEMVFLALPFSGYSDTQIWALCQVRLVGLGAGIAAAVRMQLGQPGSSSCGRQTCTHQHARASMSHTPGAGWHHSAGVHHAGGCLCQRRDHGVPAPAPSCQAHHGAAARHG